ncbi:hypothetical protein [uncultured Tyzzerella sp.]|uniref:hypothetical protein n=1 Tax=uncultured Tyzzerella sp. TaxID=2321398 RepID=UPI002942B516|nr:hypothetical protein [uncultured Tyzzerella sp.]
MIKSMPILIGVITFVIVIKIMLKKSDNGYDKSVDDFMQRELEANNTIKDFDKLDINFVEPSNVLPFIDYENIPTYKKVIKKQDLVKRKIELDMIKIPSNLTNTELKEMYGVNNFDKISKLEEHYNSYVRGLFEWAEELYNLNNIYDCKKVLLEAVRLEANISQVYILLAKIYFKENDKSSLTNLKNNINDMDLSLKKVVLEEIEKYL